MNTIDWDRCENVARQAARWAASRSKLPPEMDLSDAAHHYALWMADQPELAEEHTDAWWRQRIRWRIHDDRKQWNAEIRRRARSDVQPLRAAAWTALDGTTRAGGVKRDGDGRVAGQVVSDTITDAGWIDADDDSVWVDGHAVSPEAWVIWQEERAEHRRRLAWLRAELPGMDEAARLCYMDGLTQAEVAEKLGITQQAVSGRIQKCLKKQREKWL